MPAARGARFSNSIASPFDNNKLNKIASPFDNNNLFLLNFP